MELFGEQADICIFSIYAIVLEVFYVKYILFIKDIFSAYFIHTFVLYFNRPLPEVKWNKRGKEMYSNKYTYKDYGKTLLIRNVDFDDEGTYECVGSNGVGTPITHAMTITVNCKYILLLSFL